jgi:soluble lytic murein transglycosylase-like protein
MSMLKHATCALCLLAAMPADAGPSRHRQHSAHAAAHRHASPSPLDLRPGPRESVGRRNVGGSHPELDALIARHAAAQGVPAALVHRIILRESRYNPRARNRAYWGLMQIRHDTARSMGYRGPASGLLDANTNLTYGVPYLANAYMVAGGNANRAVSLYAGGYYYEAKRKHLLGRLRTAHQPIASAAQPDAVAQQD